MNGGHRHGVQSTAEKFMQGSGEYGDSRAAKQDLRPVAARLHLIPDPPCSSSGGGGQTPL